MAARLKIVGYVRVSTVGQVKDGLGLPTQERLIRAWAKGNDYRITKIVSDNGKSGALAETERPGLLQALSAIWNGEADAMVVSSIDRLARALTVQEAILAEVWKAKGKIYTVDGGEVLPDDVDDPLRTFARKVIGLAVELEKALISKRLRNGRITKKKRGGYAGGAPRLGYVAEEKELVRFPAEEAAVRLMLRLRRQGASYRQIADALHEKGYKPRRAASWSPMVIKRVCDRG